jgi:hypothetical protein
LAGSPGQNDKPYGDQGQAERQSTSGVGQDDQRGAKPREQRRRRLDHR